MHLCVRVSSHIVLVTRWPINRPRLVSKWAQLHAGTGTIAELGEDRYLHLAQHGSAKRTDSFKESQTGRHHLVNVRCITCACLHEVRQCLRSACACDPVERPTTVYSYLFFVSVNCTSLRVGVPPI